MSFVICCATSEYGIIASDGRMVDAETEEVLRDDYQKVVRVNDRLVIGFAGDESVCELSLAEMSKKYRDADNSIDRATVFLKSFLQMLSLNGAPLCKTTFYVLGSDDTGTIRFNTVTSIGAIRVIEHVPENKDDIRIAYCGCEVSKSVFCSILSSIQDFGFVSGLTLEIRKVADTHPTVGKQVYIQSIRHERIHPHKERSDTSCP